MSEIILTSKPMREAQTLTRPSFVVPPGACDSHVHVFESPDRYPRVDNPHYTLPDGSLDKLNRMTEFIKPPPFLKELESTFVIGHMGYMVESDGLTNTDLHRLLGMICAGRGWIKLSAPYRLAKDGNFERLKPKARDIISAAPDRVVWGSDWPHIPEGGKDTGALLNLLSDWAPDAKARERILVSNPVALFKFD